MVRVIIWALSALIICGMSYAVQAQDAATKKSHAMVMHGDMKYADDFTHFEYVNPDAPKGGILRQHVIGSFDSMNPFIVKGSPVAGINFIGQNFLYDSLMVQSYDEPFSMYCLLCETVERDPANMKVTFNLHPEAKWHDGKTITAEDVVFSFNTFMAHGTPFFKGYYGDVKEAIAENTQRVTFTFKHDKNAELALILSQLSIIPKHYWETRMEEFTQTSLTPPLSSGPYQIEKADAGRQVVYKRFDDYWAKDLAVNKGRYNFDRIEYDYYRDSNVALEAFFSGEYDTRLENNAKLWHTAYDNQPAVKDGKIIKAEISHNRPQGMQAYIYNIRRTVFADPKVREALAYAFDFEWSNKQFAYGKYTRSYSYFSNSNLASKGLPEGRELEILEKYRGQIPDEVFTSVYKVPMTDGSGNNRKNLRIAKRILDAAGWASGEDGIRAKDGVRLSFEILYGHDSMERWTLPFIQNLKRLGVEAKFRVVDSAQFQNRVNNFDYDMIIGGFGQSDSPGNEQRDFWGSAKADTDGSRNYIGVKNPAIDALIEELIKAGSRKELVAYTRALDRILLWNHFIIPQWYVNYWPISWWEHIAKPDKLSWLSPAITTTWWSVEAESID